jgi:purine catabolism regulator
MSSPGPRLTVAAALSLPALRRGLPEVVAGAAGVGRPIRWVHAAEVANIASLLRGGELLLTTGMGMPAGSARQRAFAAELDSRGIAGLVVELGGALAVLPPGLIEAAEARGLPLVALHREVPFVTVTEEIHTEIVEREHSLLRRGDEVHRQFAQTLLDGDGVPGVLAALARLVGNPVVLEDADGGLLSHADGPGAATDTVAAWAAQRQAPGRQWSGALTRPVPLGPRGSPGRLVVLPLHSPLGDLAEVAAERAAGIVALTLLQTEDEQHLRSREGSELLAGLREGRIDAADAAAQAWALGFAAGPGPLVPVAVRFPGGEIPPPAIRDLGATLGRGGHRVLAGAGRERGLLLAVLAIAPGGDRRGALDAFAAAVHGRSAAGAGAAAAGERPAGPGASAGPTIVAGRPVDWPALGGGLALAAEGAAAAAAGPFAAWQEMDALELPRLLWRWREDPELEALVSRTLGPLLAHDRHSAHRLLPTLEALCARGGHKTEAARDLHLNRQAIYRRVARIERLLNVDLADPAALQLLSLALAARRFAPAPTGAAEATKRPSDQP